MVRVRYSFGSRHTGRIENIKKQRAKYPEVMREVIGISDIVLEVLDARYIEETRNVDIEESIDAAGKKLVFVFNKCDLVDVEELRKQIPNWMRPYVFVSATSKIGLNDLKGRVNMEAKRIIAERRAGMLLKEKGDEKVEPKFKKKRYGVGKEKLRGEKKMAKEKRDENWGRVHVGVIGVPNAGKSSVINFVTHRSAAKTGAKAGFTKGMQKIKMSDGVLILDTPGVIPESRYTTERKGFAEDVKIGARSYSDVRDPERAVLFLIRAAPAKDPENLTEKEKAAIAECEKTAVAIGKFYKIDFGADIEILIEELGKRKGFLGKGGIVDEDRTARLILRDWQEGKIRIK
jgi:ribosome biogenesis GTPase A